MPAGSRFRWIRFRRERWLTPGGETLVAALPAWVEGHFGPALKRYVLAQYHQGQVTVPRLTTQLNDLGLPVSKRHVVRLLTTGKEGFRDEAIGVLRAAGNGALGDGRRHRRPAQGVLVLATPSPWGVGSGSGSTFPMRLIRPPMSGAVLASTTRR